MKNHRATTTLPGYCLYKAKFIFHENILEQPNPSYFSGLRTYICDPTPRNESCCAFEHSWEKVKKLIKKKFIYLILQIISNENWYDYSTLNMLFSMLNGNDSSLKPF